MKSFFAGLMAFLVIGLLAYNSLKDRGLINLKPEPSPSPEEIIIGNWDMEPEVEPETEPEESPSPTPKPAVAGVATTKGGVTLGAVTYTPAPKVTTKTVTKTYTTTTILETADCELDATTYIRDIDSPITIKYWLDDDYTATVTAWTTIGEQLLPQTMIQGSGVLFEYKGNQDIKLQTVSKKCQDLTESWIRLTLEK